VSDTLQRILIGDALSAADAEAAFDRCMTGDASPVEMAVLLSVLKVRGESPIEVASGVRSLRKAMIPLELDTDLLVDTCGTGGGTLTTFNISTASSIVAAGAGIKIAKHGNRSFTSKCGSADVLEALGVPTQLNPSDQKRMFAKAGFVFMFAPSHHPAMRHVGPVRGELGVTTIMNLLGPLANPAGVRRQVIGVSHGNLQRLIADSLVELGHERAMVVHGAPGMDELSPLGPTTIIQLDGGRLDEIEILPADFGWPKYAPEDLNGGEPRENAEQIRQVITGKQLGGARAAVLINAAAAIWVSGEVQSLEEGVAAAEASIDDGKAAATLDILQTFR
jgi:anthranilate phosphoribosyltransferase